MFSFIKSLFCKPQPEIVLGPSAEDIFNARLKSHQAKYPSLFDITKYTFGPNSAIHESGDEFKFVAVPLELGGYNVNPPKYIMSTISFNEFCDLEKCLLDAWKIVMRKNRAEQQCKDKIEFVEKYGEPKC